jgi:hypothetical protein
VVSDFSVADGENVVQKLTRPKLQLFLEARKFEKEIIFRTFCSIFFSIFLKTKHSGIYWLRMKISASAGMLNSGKKFRTRGEMDKLKSRLHLDLKHSPRYAPIASLATPRFASKYIARSLHTSQNKKKHVKQSHVCPF